MACAGCAPAAHVTGGALVDTHDPGTALAALDEACGARTACPPHDRARIDLERAFVAHAAGARSRAERLFETALDLEPLLAGAVTPKVLARRAYGVVRPPYTPLVTESLAALGFRMLTTAEAGDLEGARRAAVRFSELRERLYEAGDRTEHAAFGSFLAGQVFAALGRADVAGAYYREVLATRESLLSRAALARIEDRADPLSRAYLAAPHPHEGAHDPGLARVVIIVAVGHVPPVRPQRLPIDFAWTLAGPYLDALGIDDGMTRLEQVGIEDVVIPELAPEGTQVDAPALWIDDARIRLEELSDLSAELEAEHRRLRRPMVAAALVRAIEGQDPLFLRAPDTRSVTTLPARVFAAEVDVPAGLHQIRARATIDRRVRQAATAVRMRDGDVAVVGLTVL